MSWDILLVVVYGFTQGVYLWRLVVSAAIFRGGATICCALNYGLGFSRASAVNGVLHRTKIEATHGKRGTSVYIMGAYSIARVTSGGYQRTVRQLIGRRPNTFIMIAKYCTRLGPNSITRVGKISIILNTRRGDSLLQCLNGLRGRRRKRTFAATAGSVHSFSPSYSHKSHAHFFLGIRSNYSCFYSCYAVPFTHKHDHGKAVTSVIRRTKRTITRNKGRVMLANIGVKSFNGAAERAFFSLMGTLSRIRNVRHCHVSSVRPGLLASRVVRFMSHSHDFVPRFRVPLRSNDSRILGLVHHHCSATLFTSGIGGVGRIVPSTFVNISIVINAHNRARRCFRRTCRFVTKLSIARLRIFDCSRHPNARTLGVSCIISPRRGRRHDRQLLTLSSRGARTFCTQRVKRAVSILVRGSGTKAPVRKFARGCVHIRIRTSGSLSGRMVGIHLKSFGRSGATLGNAVLVWM